MEMVKTGLTRRQFGKLGGIAALAAAGCSRQKPVSAAPEGEVSYEAAVPDTLDLAERAVLSVNALTGAVEPEHDYETYQSTHLDHNPPYMNHRWGGPCLQKPIHALPMLRSMSGSKLRADYDARMVEGITRNIDDQGLWWLKTERAPWRAETMKEDQCWPVAQGRLMVALLDWYKYDRNPQWLKMVERMAGGLQRIVLRSSDHAWYYTAYTRSGWKEHPNPQAGSQTSSSTVKEPDRQADFNIGLPLRGLARWYEVSGDKRSLELAQALVRFYLKPSMWALTEEPGMAVPSERALWAGHFHSRTMGMIGLLDYAIITNDTRLKRFVANFYEHGRHFGLSRIGFFPAVIGPLDKIKKAALNYGGTGSTGQCDEGCAVADMTWLAVTLSEAGVGDYWEDADQYVRNHLVEHQILRRDLLEAIIESGPSHTLNRSMETDKDVLERNIGSFVSGTDPTMAYAWWTMCCNANCAMALYKAWSSIVRHADGVAQVNLLLNRASPWLDVDSYLPYEGRVVLKNKTSRKARVRIPTWADKKQVRSRLNQQEVSLPWFNNYLVLDSWKPADVLTIEFPVAETAEKYTDATYQEQYTCRLRGNTLVDISPRAERPHYTSMGSDDGAVFPVKKGYPLYQRDFYKGDKAPIKNVRRYASATLI